MPTTTTPKWAAIFSTGHSTIRRWFDEEPEHREIEDYVNRYGAHSATVRPPTPTKERTPPCTHS